MTGDGAADAADGGAGETDVSGFPTPPFGFEDGDGRRIRVLGYGDHEGVDDREALLSMYEAFDPSDRAQGIPPLREDALGRWLDTVLGGVNVVAWDEATGDAVGHATLISGDDAGYELAIFVLQSHQRSGIGGRLIRGALSAAYQNGVRRVWLTVERWNRAALRLYRDVGFERVGGEGMEIEMATRLVGGQPQ